MIEVLPTGETLGATIDGIDLNTELDHQTFAAILQALGWYGVLRVPQQGLARRARWRSQSLRLARDQRRRRFRSPICRRS